MSAVSTACGHVASYQLHKSVHFIVISVEWHVFMLSMRLYLDTCIVFNTRCHIVVSPIMPQACWLFEEQCHLVVYLVGEIQKFHITFGVHPPSDFKTACLIYSDLIEI